MAATYPTPPPVHHRFVTVRIDDVSTGGSAWVVPGFRGRIRKIHAVIDGALSTDDAALTFEIGGTEVSGSGITLAEDSSAAGDAFSSTPPIMDSTNRFDPDQPIECITDGGSTNTVAAVLTLELEPV